MNKKTKIIASSLAITVLATSIFTFASFSGKNFFARSSASANGTITFVNSVVSGTTSVSTGTTSTGGTVKCVVTNNDSSVSSSYVGALVVGSEIHFYEADGITEYTFEDIDKIAFKYGQKFGFYLHVLHVDGEEKTYGNPYATNAVSSSGYRTISFTGDSYKDISHIWVECTGAASASGSGTTPVLMEEVVLTYNCNTKYQTGISIDTAPTKTSYFIGDSFDPTGMIVKATYSNNTSVATTAYTYSPSVLSATDSFVTISHNGFSTTQAITVSENTYTGTYQYTNASNVVFTLVLNSDSSGYYHVYYSGSYDNYMHFTYSVSVVSSTTTITFTRDQQSGDSVVDSGYYNLFTTSGSYNDTNDATINSSGNILLKTCAASNRASSTKEMVKQ